MGRIHTKVLLVGGGPVGLTLAIDLAQRGIDVAITEIRVGGEVPGVRCNHVAARTMEIFQSARLGPGSAQRWSASRLSERRSVPHHRNGNGAFAHSDPVPC